MRLSSAAALTLSIVAASLVTPAAALTDDELTAVRDAFDARRDQVLHRQVAMPYPPIKNADGHLNVWNRLDYALAALYLNVEVPAANEAVVAAARQSAENVNDARSAREGHFHWEAPLYCRIYEFFHTGSRFFPGRLSPEAAAAIRKVCWQWARTHSCRADAELSKTWHFWGSENHDAMRNCSTWGIAKILKDDPEYARQRYEDGSTPAEQYEAWTRYLTQCLRERIGRGLTVEMGSPTYSKYTLQCWYNYYDFADEPLRRMADAALTVYWTDWAQEQLGAVRGGGKSRCYQGSDSQQGLADAAAAMVWFYLGIGREASQHPGTMCMATSAHRLPLVVMDLALDVSGRGVYECRSRRAGLRQVTAEQAGPPPDAETGINVLSPDFGGIVKYTYCTPEFILGANLLAQLPLEAWSGISMQNRWQGAIFAGEPDARIFPQCVGQRNGKTYNAEWAVQHRGTLIVQRLPEKKCSKQAGPMRVWVASCLKRWEAGDWVLAEASGAWAAVRPAFGAYAWDDKNWMRCRDLKAPVILEVARKADYPTREAFQAAVLTDRLTVSDDVLHFRGLGTAGMFTFYLESDRLPEVDGKPIDLRPTKTYDSPFLQEDWDRGVVTVTKGNRTLTIDVARRP